MWKTMKNRSRSVPTGFRIGNLPDIGIPFVPVSCVLESPVSVSGKFRFGTPDISIPYETKTKLQFCTFDTTFSEFILDDMFVCFPGVTTHRGCIFTAQ
jgi:hypothetical protein